MIPTWIVEHWEVMVFRRLLASGPSSSSSEPGFSPSLPGAPRLMDFCTEGLGGATDLYMGDVTGGWFGSMDGVDCGVKMRVPSRLILKVAG